jgi:16S rRNA (cytidine1402-2'-O)-methyltransferase
MPKGILVLIPTLLGETNPTDVLPDLAVKFINNIKHFVVEDIKTARRFLKKVNKSIVIDDLEFFVLNKQTQYDELSEMLDAAINGEIVGLMSEAGLPGVADPGALLVALAHKKGIKVKPLSGPSSIFMALMSSGLNGQGFTFNGYLPRDESNCRKALISLESKAHKENQSQIFMETPYRNNKIFDIIISSLKPETYLCIASDISTESESILTKKIKDWKKQKPDLNKRPSIFIIQ